MALLVPGTCSATYVWGDPRDEPFQALASTPWAVRNAVPLTPPGNIRMLDAIEERFAQGDGSPALADYMRRSGISHMVVRNDLDAQPTTSPTPCWCTRPSTSPPGLAGRRTFGPALGGGAHVDGELGRALINGGWQNDYAAIEVYALDEAPTPGRPRTRRPSSSADPRTCST